MRRTRRPDDRPLPEHPYRDTMLVYGAMAVVLVIVVAVTGGDVLRALVAAVLFFVLASAYGCWKFRNRIRARNEAMRATAAGRGDDTSGSGRGDTP